MIRIVTTLIMTPWSREFDTIEELIQHLLRINYLRMHMVTGELLACDGVTLHAEEHDELYVYTIGRQESDYIRSHRIEFSNYNHAVEFEDRMNDAKMPVGDIDVP